MWYRALEYGRYRLAAKSKHGVHSPFVYDLLTQVYEDSTRYPDYAPVEALRHSLREDHRILEIQDFGAANVQDNPDGVLRQRKVAELVKRSAKPKFWAQFLYRLCRYYQPQVILELGTSLGISGAYQLLGALQSGQNRQVQLITLEGSEAIAREAQANLSKLGIAGHAQVIPGSFEKTLDKVLADLVRVDFVFIDGNHRKVPTLMYLDAILKKVHDDSIIVFDDIHWSEEMTEAWEEIKRNPRVTVSIDFYTLGLVFLRKGQVKEHFVLR